MRKTLSDKGVRALKSHAGRYALPDPQLTGHYIRVQPTGGKTYVAVARDPTGKQVWTTLGSPDILPIETAREMARERIQRIRAGLPPVEAPPAKPDTFEDVAQQWLKRHVQAKGLRSEGEVTRLLKAHVYPRWQDRPFLEIRRSDVAALLDEVEDDHGARQADYVLAIVRGVMNWFATRHDSYVPAIVKGMRRTNPKERARSRVLDDAELANVWAAAETNGTFGAFVRLALLTGQRRDTVASMKWADITIDGEWRIPVEERQKGTAGSLMLPDMALSIIRAQPRMVSNAYILAGRGNVPIGGWSKLKRAFDAKLPPDMPGWHVHDLRRTARSLLSRAGVHPDIGERVLGHKLQGVRAIYDQHEFRDEKADALRRLAAVIETIVGSKPDNVIFLCTQ